MRSVLHRLLHTRLVVVGMAVTLVVVLLALLAPAIAPYSPTEMDPFNALLAPNKEHLFGTDAFGRDVLSRVIVGSRISLRIGVLVVLGTTALGGAIGLITGYFPRLDNIIMRLVDATMALPTIVLALAIVSIFKPSEACVVVALVVVYTPRTARIVRGTAIAVRTQPYVEASRAIGSSHLRILYKDILPNCIATLIVQGSFVLAYAILAEAALSFLGAGPPPPAPSWGNIMSEGRSLLRTAPWISTFPGFAIILTVLGINLLGDGLRDAADPKTSGERFDA